MTEIHFYTTLEAEIWYATYIKKNKMIFGWLLGFVWVFLTNKVSSAI